jgi:uncharacterized SAM-binding protein YcdF (DUF218 family)
VSLFLSKLLPVFVYPLGAALILGALALILLVLRFRQSGLFLLGVVLAGLWIGSTPIFANWLMARLETENPAVAVESLPEADAIILLGGFMDQPLTPRIYAELNEAADRVIGAWRLFSAGKAPVILVSGGNLPWRSGASPEAELAADLLAEFRVPSSAIVVEAESRNTYENAVNTAAIFEERGWTSGLLVTSAAHMPRALATFRKTGLEVVPVSTDVQVRFPLYDSLLDFLPDAEALERTTSAIKEIIGSAVYRSRGWT